MKVKNFVCCCKYITVEQKSKSVSGTALHKIPIKIRIYSCNRFSVMLK